jgi:hypothetical protein
VSIAQECSNSKRGKNQTSHNSVVAHELIERVVYRLFFVEDRGLSFELQQRDFLVIALRTASSG